MKDTVHKIEEKMPGHHKVRQHDAAASRCFAADL